MPVTNAAPGQENAVLEHIFFAYNLFRLRISTCPFNFNCINVAVLIAYLRKYAAYLFLCMYNTNITGLHKSDLRYHVPTKASFCIHKSKSIYMYYMYHFLIFILKYLSTQYILLTSPQYTVYQLPVYVTVVYVPSAFIKNQWITMNMCRLQKI